jgi:hypothetical protein
MIFAADTHVHLYPYYDLTEVLRQGSKNLDLLIRTSASQDQTFPTTASHCKLLFLTEGQNYHFFHQFQEGLLQVEGTEFKINNIEKRIIEMASSKRESLYLIAGRQIVTKEKIEILGLMMEKEISNGLPAEEVIDQIQTEGGIPVLSWAPGKWLFSRGKVIQNLLQKYTSKQILLGDTTLRPEILKTPEIFTSAHKRGYLIVPGSDPLPFSGEEKWVGSYGIVSRDIPEEKDLFSTIRAMIFSGAYTAAGKRGSLVSVGHRLGHHFFCRCL